MMSADSRHEASETSPLLGDTTRTSQRLDDQILTPKSTDDTDRTDIENSITTDNTSSASTCTSIQPSSSTKLPTKTLWIVIPSVSIGVFLAALDSTITISSYGRIGSDLHALNLTSWIATSYFLSLTSFQPLYGKLSDIFGRKNCLLFAYAVFGLGTLGCGLTGGIYGLIAARIFQGVGGGGMTTVVSILMSDVVSLEDRGVWQGLINIVWAVGSASGASLGGIISDSFGWRWAFLMQFPICILAILSVAIVLKLPQQPSNHHSTPTREMTLSDQLRRIDFLGACVLVFAVFCLLFGMDRGSNVSWRLPTSYGPLMASVILFAAFVYVETAVAREPFAPGHVIFGRTMVATYVCYFCSFGAWTAVLYYAPLYYQAVDGLSASAAAVRLLPAIVASVTGSLTGGFFMKRFGRYYWLTVISYTVLVAGIITMLLSSGLLGKSTWGISIALFVGAFGNGIGMTSSLIALIANSKPEDQAIAIACTYLFRSLGATIGISLVATVIQQTLRSSLRQELGSGKDAAKIEMGVRQSLTFIDNLSPELQRMVRSVYGQAVRHGYVVAIGIATGALLASCFLRERRLK